MPHHKLFCLFSALLFTMSSVVLRAQTNDKDIATTIIAMERAALDNVPNQGFVEISMPDVVYIDPDLTQPIYGRDALATYYKNMPVGAPDPGKMTNVRVQVIGEEAAVLTFNYVGQRSLRMGWNCTEVYRKTPQGWRIIQTHWSYTKSRPVNDK